LRGIAHHVYTGFGTDLAVKHASEIAGFSSVWEWIQARIREGYFGGIGIGDYIQLLASDGNEFLMEVAGINTYKGYGDTEVGNHIDFISRDCHPLAGEAARMNRVTYNNGTTESPSPWLASELHKWLNSLQGEVPNATTAGGTPLVAVDYMTTGVWDKLPQALRDVIVQKRLLLPSRYTAGSLLIDDNNFAWADAGLLWIPFEMEVYGTNVWGSLVPLNPGYSVGGFQQYPLFAHNMKRVKGAGNGGTRTNWWLGSARGGNSTSFVTVYSTGYASSPSASAAGIRAPLCFRIA